MILRLLRQDPAWGALVFSLPIALLYGAMVRTALGEEAGRGIYVFFMLLFHLMVTWVVIASNISNRCSRLALALPLSPRLLWPVRMFALLAVSGLTLGLFALTVLWQAAPSGGGSTLAFMADSLQRLAAAQLLLPFLLQAPRPRLYKISGDSWYLIYTLLVVAGLGLFVPFAPGGRAALGVAIPSAVLVGLITFLRLPRSLRTSPDQSEDAPSREVAAPTPVAATARPGDAGGPSLHWIALRLLANHWMGWLGYLSSALFSMTLVFSFADSRSLTTQNAVLGLWIWALLANGIARLYKLDAWPVSRRLLLACTLLPGLAAAALGASAGLIILRVDPEHSAMVEVRDHALRAPSEFLELSRDGEVPAQTAPWGESHRPMGKRLWPGADAVVYNPFEWGAERSAEYRAWQIDRAVARVHGTGPRQDAPIRLDEARRNALEQGSFTVKDSIGRGSPLRTRTLALAGLGGVLILTMVLSLGMSIYRGYTAQKTWRVPAFMGLVALLALSALVGSRLGVFSATALDALPMILMRQAAEALPLPTGVLWIIDLLAAMIAYRLIEAQFMKVEVSIAHRPKPAIQEW